MQGEKRPLVTQCAAQVTSPMAQSCPGSPLIASFYPVGMKAQP